MPGAPQCCDNLVKVSCGKPDQNGECSAPCAGASICANCGDGVCGKGENKCNCPQDCDRCTERGSECKSACDQGQTQVDYFCDGKVACCYGVSDCLAQGGSCKVACDNDETKSDTACRDGLACCKPNQACTPLGQGFMGSGTCCPGLTAVPDCDQGANGCACKKCLCYVCLPVKDGVCGPYEHSCNSPDDCPTADKCLPTKQSPCEGTPSGEPAEGVLKLTPQPNALVVELTAFTMNCCRLAELCVQQRVGEIVITVKTRPSYTPCKCICLFSLSTTIDGIRAGIYKVTVYDELAAELTKPLHSVDAVEIK